MLLKCYISSEDKLHKQNFMLINTEHIVKIFKDSVSPYIILYLSNGEKYFIKQIGTKYEDMYLDMTKNSKYKDEYVEDFLFNVFGG